MRLFILLLSILVEQTLAIERNKIYMTKAEMQDQTVSDTKYIYTADTSSIPAEYKESPSSANFEYPEHFVSERLQQFPTAYGSGHAKSDGKDYDEEYYTRKGTNGQTGYDKEVKFADGVKGQHEHVDNSGFYKTNGGASKNHLDNSQRYASKYDYVDGHDGGYTKKSSDSKHDAKTQGYHKRFSKDEYKKKHTFYDVASSKGSFNKYGDYDKYHKEKSGGVKSGLRGNTGYYEDYYGEKGHRDKGRYRDDDAKYEGQKGDSKYYKDYADYAKRGNREESEKS